MRRLASTSLALALAVGRLSTAQASDVSPATTTTRELQISYPIQVWPITVYFERTLDLDHDEHASLEMTFVFKNTSDSAICEFSGSGVLNGGTVQRRVLLSYVKRLKPAEIRSVDVDVNLDKGDKDDIALRSMPLVEMKIHWITDKVKTCDGALYTHLK